MSPAHELVPVTASRAPMPPAPVPEIVNVSAPTARPVVSWRVALLATVVPPAVVPRAPAFEMARMPALTLVVPVYELLFDRVRVPEPILVRPLPLMAPLMARELASTATV